MRVTLGIGDRGPGAPDGALFEEAGAGLPLESHWGGFADYELGGVIARGGMGVVYRARQRGLNRAVAIKMIGGGLLARPEDLIRFRNEAEAVARLHHPNIIAIYEVGEHDGQPWFSMQYVAGPSLAAAVRDAPLVPIRAATVMRQVCGAIQHAHERGILHRDLKPSNILLDENDEPRVTDFGVAKFAQRESEVTGTDRVIGSPSYMAPEQASGHSRDVDARSDVYSLGAVLYELLTGRPPFQADTPVQTLKLVVDAEPVPPRQLNPAIPVDLETICLKCLAKEPARRYAQAREVGDELAAFLEHRPIRARPTSRLELVRRWSRRNAGLAGALTALTLALVAGLAGTTWQWRRAEGRRRDLAAHQYDLLVARAVAERRSGVVGQRFAALDALRQAAELRPGQEALRNEAITTLALADFRPGKAVAAPAAQVQRASPDFLHLARGATNGTVAVIRIGDDAVEAVLGETDLHGVVGLGFSRDGSRLWAAHTDGRICLWDWRNTRCLQRTAARALRPGLIPVFTPDNGTFIFAGETPRLTVMEVVAGATRALELPFTPRILALSPTGDRVAVTAWSDPSSILLVALATGEPTGRLELPDGVSANVGAWSPDGEWVAVSGLDLKTYLFRPAAAGRPVRVLNIHDNTVTSMAFDPSSSMLVSSSWDGTTQLHGLADARRLLQWPAEARDLRFATDGTRLSYRGPHGEIVIGDFVAQRLCRTLGGGEVPEALEGLHWGEFSRDSRWLTSASAAGTRIFEVSRGHLQETLTTRPCRGAWLFGDQAWIVDNTGKVERRRWPAEATQPALTGVVTPVPRATEDVVEFGANGDLTFMAVGRQGAFQFGDGPRVPLGWIGLVDEVSLNRTGSRIVLSAGDRRDVWDTAAGRKLLTLPRLGIRGSASVDSSGTRVCCQELQAVTCYAVPSGQVLWTVPQAPEGLSTEMHWSADDRWIVVQSGMTRIDLRASDTGRLLARIEHPEARMIRHLALSDDGRWLAVACARSILQVWDLPLLRQELRPLGLDWRD